MSDKPILFSGPMVRALLAGRKTQTRRSLKPQPNRVGKRWEWRAARGTGAFATPFGDLTESCVFASACRYDVGDCLWVRERMTRWNLNPAYGADGCTYDADRTGVWGHGDIKRTTGGRAAWIWKQRNLPSIHMPRWASRLTLTVTGMRVHRLQEIGPDDVMAEGCSVPFEDYGDGTPESWFGPGKWFEELWDSINGAGSWEANPWVAAYTFTVEQKNIDA